MEKLLHDVYYNLKSPACLAGSTAVYKEAKNRNKNITLQKVKDFLAAQDVYTKHKPARRRFPRNKTIPMGFHTDWQIDICDFQKLKKYNQGHAYILTVIDVLSRFAWAVPLKTKSPKDTSEAFQKILDQSGKVPWRLCSDDGKEWMGKFKELIKQHDIVHIIPKSEMKAAVVERYNRTLKTRLYKLFTKNSNHNWIDHLQEIVSAINRSVNRITGVTPASVTYKNAHELWRKMYGKKKTVEYRFKIGDKVRVSVAKSIFAKGYTQSFNTEIFTIHSQLPRDPPVYKLKDSGGEIVQGSFYQAELVGVTKTDEIFEIEKVIRKRVRDGQTELYVKWLGYPTAQNSWIKEEDLVSK